MVTTKEGRVFYSRCKKVLSDIQQLSSNISQPHSKRDVIRIGTFEVFSTYVIAECAGDFSKICLVKCLELAPGHIESAIVSESVDFGVTYAPIPQADLTVDEICKFTFGVFGRPKFKSLPLDELKFVVPTTSVPQNPSQLHDLDSWPISKLPRSVGYEFEMLQTGLLVSSPGLGVIHCPRFIVRLHNSVAREEKRLVDIPLLGLPKQQHSVYLMRKKGRPEDAYYKKLTKHLRVICQDR